jgi:integrase
LVARRRFELLSWGPRPTLIHKTLSKFIDYCRIDECLRPSVIHGYKYIAKRFLLSSKGELSKDSIRRYLSKYLDGAPKTYNNQLDGLRAFIGRFLGHPELMNGFKKAHQTTTYEFNLPTLEQVRLGFEGLTDNRERAIYLMFLTSGLRKSELLDLTVSEIDFNTRSIKSRHDTRTKKAGVTFYNEECETYLQRYLDSRTDKNEKLFRIGTRDYMRIWTKASENANFKITAQVCRKWHSTMLGELMVPDRFVDIFQGRAPKSVLAKHYTGRDFDRLRNLYNRIDLKIFTPSISIFSNEVNNAIQVSPQTLLS